VTPHDLRATHGSWVARSHGIMAAAKRLGHSNANVTTRHYAREVDDRDAEIAASFGPRPAALGARGGHEEAAQDHVSDPRQPGVSR
jgi:integrase